MSDNKKDEEKNLIEKKSNPADSGPKKPKPLRKINYEYLNGLRGWGAFAVFLFHYTEAFWKLDKHPDDPNIPLDGSWNTP